MYTVEWPFNSAKAEYKFFFVNNCNWIMPYLHTNWSNWSSGGYMLCPLNSTQNDQIYRQNGNFSLVIREDKFLKRFSRKCRKSIIFWIILEIFVCIFQKLLNFFKCFCVNIVIPSSTHFLRRRQIFDWNFFFLNFSRLFFPFQIFFFYQQPDLKPFRYVS